jgi:RnfABCDGE-type electron transport complex B subunit
MEDFQTMNILLPALIIGGIGAICGIILTIASTIMAVPVDEKIEKIKSVLPGANCGACGFPGCDGYAHAIAKGEAPITSCPPGGAELVDDLSNIMGIEAGQAVQEKAVVLCRCCDMVRMDKLNYIGENTCTYASQMYGGPTACFFACQGFGDCISSCKYDAIRIINGLAVVDPSLCVGCKLCVASCPKGLIQMTPVANTAVVFCSSKDWGPHVRKVCSLGCIGCSRCEKTCTKDAIKVENYLAKVDYDKCDGCGDCVKICPMGIIYAIQDNQ